MGEGRSSVGGDGAGRVEDAPTASLDGYWTGVFDTRDATLEATPFHGVVFERGGALSGDSVEPNWISADPCFELFAEIAGWRDGCEVEFLKTYEDAIGLQRSIRFEGALSPEGDRIVGVWYVVDDHAMGGPFVMNRAADPTDTLLEAIGVGAASSDSG